MTNFLIIIWKLIKTETPLINQINKILSKNLNFKVNKQKLLINLEIQI